MAKNLVIVESPAKAKTIEKFLGPDFHVLSCFGHIRDLPKNKLNIDIKNGYEPNYEIPADKKKLVADLKKQADAAETVWLASDEDREGEAISWHLMQVLKLTEKKTKRIVFNEITKSAILSAIERPRKIDINLVDAQQARRVLDRFVGYEISPVLWRKVRPQLSAGRVQSVATRLIVEREDEIKNFKETSAYRVTADFKLPKVEKTLEAELNKRFAKKDEAEKFLNDSNGASFVVSDVETKPAKKSPAPPFTTSTLPQEASRKLGFSVSKTMLVAQQLYEAGFITYMRTDSVNLSQQAMGMAESEINTSFGKKYVKLRQYSTKTKGAQEAHEAIRPTAFDKQSIEGDASQKRLYDLIWKRTIASQMSDAELEKTTVTINISTRPENFNAKGEVLIFDGFLKVYIESSDDDNDEDTKGVLPPIKVKDALELKKAIAKESFTQHAPRYSEASLVKKMEELGIGRPSTYAPTISTILKRKYVVKEDREAVERSYNLIELSKGAVKSSVKTEKTGSEKSKLFPTDIGVLVNNFLVENFSTVIDYNFTAAIEKEFDEVAQGEIKWAKMMDGFYKPFHKQVDETMKNSERVSGERLVGVDPKTKKNIYVKIGRFGPMAQIGEATDEEKPTFAGLKAGQSIDTISLEDVLELFKLPREVGTFEGEKIVAAAGRFGPYLRLGKNFYSIPKTDDPLEISEKRAIEIIEEKRISDANKMIKEFADNDIRVLNGRFGPYIVSNKKNFRIPKTTDPTTLTLEDCLSIIEGSFKSEAPAKKATAKKVSAKKAEEKPEKKAPAKKAAAKKTTTKTKSKK